MDALFDDDEEWVIAAVDFQSKLFIVSLVYSPKMLRSP